MKKLVMISSSMNALVQKRKPPGGRSRENNPTGQKGLLHNNFPPKLRV